jgi:hypothetical protein
MGSLPGEMHRATSAFGEDGTTQTCLDERTVASVRCESSMG